MRKASFSTFLFVLTFCSLFFGGLFSAQASSATDATSILLRPTTTENMSKREEDDDNDEKLLIVFSDLDGTLIHYPRDRSTSGSFVNENGSRILELPPSATGMKGIISSGTLVRCQALRRKNIKLVLMSGMRTETLLKRLPYLPRADAYCTESGGRIFYPTIVSDDGKKDLTFTPTMYDGAMAEDLVPFSLQEDMEWRSLMEQEEAAGKDGYPGNELKTQQEEIPLSDRRGAIWDFARKLEQEGFVLDTKSYSTCFRVNRDHQKENVSKEKFDAFLRGKIPHPTSLSCSTNLGCIDFYPQRSGKKNCCAYLAQHRFGLHISDLWSRSVCLCDDDNDIEMALACSHAFIPACSSESMKETVESNSAKFTTTFSPSVSETAATEAALDLILEKTGKTS